MDEAFRDADIVYPKSWAPLHGDGASGPGCCARREGPAAELEQQALAHNARFKDWECTAEARWR
jgi:ornithine carbamoyltransferase